MFSIKISFSKNRDILSLAGTPGTGSKNRDCPGKIGTLGRPVLVSAFIFPLHITIHTHS